MRKGFLIAVVVLGALVAAAEPGLRQRLAGAARNVERCFAELQQAGTSITPLERLIFSVALAQATPAGESETRQ